MTGKLEEIVQSCTNRRMNVRVLQETLERGCTTEDIDDRYKLIHTCRGDGRNGMGSSIKWLSVLGESLVDICGEVG